PTSCRASSASSTSASWWTGACAASSRGGTRRRCATAPPIPPCAPSSTAGRRPPDMPATTAVSHWKLGLFVVGTIAVMVGTTFWLGARGFRRESFPAVTYFDESVQGLEVGSPLKFRGVTVGTVADITIAPDRRNVQVTSDVYVDAILRLGLTVPKK